MPTSCFLLEQLKQFPNNDNDQSLPLRNLIISYCTSKLERTELEQQIESASDSDKKQLARDLRRFDYNFRKIKSQLSLELIRLIKGLRFVRQDLTASSNSTQNSQQQEYEELINDVVSDAMNLICTDLQLNQDCSLIQNILGWIQKISPLRLEYRWREINYQRKTPEEKRIEVIQELTATDENGFTLSQFIARLEGSQTVSQEKYDELKAYLDNKIERTEGVKLEKQGEIYYKFYLEKIYLSAKQTTNRELKKDPYSLDVSPQDNHNNGSSSHLEILADNNINNNLWELLDSVEKQKKTTKIINLINNYISKQDDECKQIWQKIVEAASKEKIKLDPIFAEIAVENNTKIDTVRSQYSRKFLPSVYQAIISDYSPNIFDKNPTDAQKQQYQKKDDLLRDYLEKDPENKLKNCYLIETPGKEGVVKKHLNCNAQNLIKELLFIFPQSEKSKRKNLTKLATDYQLTRGKLAHFWTTKVLRLLAKIIIDDLPSEDN